VPATVSPLTVRQRHENRQRPDRVDNDDEPAEVKKSFDAMVAAEAAFKADLEKLLKSEGQCPRTSSCFEPEGKTSWGRVCWYATR